MRMLVFKSIGPNSDIREVKVNFTESITYELNTASDFLWGNNFADAIRTNWMADLLTVSFNDPQRESTFDASQWRLIFEVWISFITLDLINDETGEQYILTAEYQY